MGYKPIICYTSLILVIFTHHSLFNINKHFTKYRVYYYFTIEVIAQNLKTVQSVIWRTICYSHALSMIFREHNFHIISKYFGKFDCYGSSTVGVIAQILLTERSVVGKSICNNYEFSKIFSEHILLIIGKYSAKSYVRSPLNVLVMV